MELFRAKSVNCAIRPLAIMYLIWHMHIIWRNLFTFGHFLPQSKSHLNGSASSPYVFLLFLRTDGQG